MITRYLDSLAPGSHTSRARYTQAWALRKAAATFGFDPEGDTCVPCRRALARRNRLDAEPLQTVRSAAAR